MIDNEIDDLQIANILSSVKTIALVGASNNWKRPSNFVMKYLQKKGYRVIPVNPRETGGKINDELCYKSLGDIPLKIDMVDVFRKSEECLELAKETIKINVKIFWMQIGIFNQEAYDLILKNNSQCIYNKCTKIEHSRIFGELGSGGFYTKLISSKKSKFTKNENKSEIFFETKNLETLSIHAGTAPDPVTGARSFPIYQSTAFTFDDSDHAASLYNLQENGNIYGRLSNNCCFRTKNCCIR